MSTLSPAVRQYIAAMPKVELHVHFQGATRPETLLTLAQRHALPLPAATVEDLRAWYTFRDFDHFIDIYDQICKVFRTPDDIELAAREFAAGQAAQHIRYTEVTYTPSLTLPFDDQLNAIQRARAWAAAALSIRFNVVIDIPREHTPADGLRFAQWAISGRDRGVVGFGIGGGPENAATTRKFAAAFELARAAGLPRVPHAGEHGGPDSIRAALEVCDPVRLGHGVRCVEDPALMAELRDRGIVLEVSPTSNVLLGVCPTLAEHPLPRLIDAGLTVTINSDDPPMFNVTLTEEYERCVETFGWSLALLDELVLNGVRAALLPDAERVQMEQDFRQAFARLHAEYGV